MAPEVQTVLNRVRTLCHGLTDLHLVGLPTELLRDLLAASPAAFPALTLRVEQRVLSRMQWIRIEELKPVLQSIEARDTPALSPTAGQQWSGWRVAVNSEFNWTTTLGT